MKNFILFYSSIIQIYLNAPCMYDILLCISIRNVQILEIVEVMIALYCNIKVYTVGFYF